jgi:hypothetical protein
MEIDKLEQLKYDLDRNMYDITYIKDGHDRIARATTNPEYLANMSSAYKERPQDAEEYAVFFDYNSYEWVCVHIGDIQEIKLINSFA